MLVAVVLICAVVFLSMGQCIDKVDFVIGVS